MLEGTPPVTVVIPSMTGRADARSRVTLVSCDDPAPVALTHKVLNRQDIQRTIRRAAGPDAGMMCHVATEAEGRLATAIGAELFACPPHLALLGTKSASRGAFAEAGVPMPDGEADLTSRADVIDALALLKERQPDLERAVVKLNDSFAGGGNAVVTYPTRPPTSDDLEQAVESASFVAAGETPARYFESLSRMGGIVEEWLAADRTMSPSVQLVISPSGKVRVQSTHEQILGGADNQTYFGCTFPANAAYSVAIAASAEQIGEVLAAKGVRGHLSIDFVCRENAEGWEHYAIEVNLRMGGATAPISFLESATGSVYDTNTGGFNGPGGRPLFYKSADRIQNDTFRTLHAEAIIERLGQQDALYNAERGSGAILYMLGAVPTVGKLGVVAVDHSERLAGNRFDSILSALHHLAARDL